MEDIITLHLTSNQALPLVKLISLRLEYLGSQDPTSERQVEYQALRSVLLQIRREAGEKVGI